LTWILHKPGYANPLVSVHIFSLEDHDAELASIGNFTAAVENATASLTWPSQLPPGDSIVFEVAWVANRSLIIKEMSRAADKGSVVFFDVGATSFLENGSGRVVRTLGEKGEEGDKGWVESVSSCFCFL
jgi:dipeptidyl aminopeptidase